MNDSTSTATLNKDVQQRIDEHLDAIDTVLQRGSIARTQRRNITDEVESQIREMLAQRAGKKPTLADLEAILAELDPPEDYGEEDQAGYICTEPAKLSMLAVVGAIFPCITLVIHLVTRVYLSRFDGVLTISLTCQGLLLLVGMVYGLIALSQIRHSRGRLYGLGLAIFAAVPVPVLLIYRLIALGVTSIVFWIRSFGLSPSVLEMVRGPVIPCIAILLILVVEFLFIRWAWRAANRPVGG